ncbi:glycosyltransferase [Maribius pontilimi]|uniref:Glycosyltransferase n=1 Tax=Palleronia pontilimi TaxID=1964209 RepID=A0A934IK08_9RHOB|nr:glycosyltransferase [Palleronia pontilimi]MBJ3764366.1 glycosyltransferase [Palleronia pontilimi]
MKRKLSITTSIHGQTDLIEEIITSFPEGGRIADIGTGSGLAARLFHDAGWEVSATGFDMEAYLDGHSLPDGVRVLADVDICDANQFEDGEFDAIWCAHVLEHVSNTGSALEELRRILKPEGWLFIAVPPYKDKVVGGHVNTGWNLGTLMYVLADAGFDLSGGRFIHHGYNVFGMVQRGPGRISNGSLHRANGDIEILAKAKRFPAGFPAKQGFDGRLPSVNWRWNRPPEDIPVPRADLANPPGIAPMKIGFFVPWITKGKGGTENVGQMMANAMAARGHDVTVFTFDDTKAPSRWPLDSSIALVHLTEAEGPPADHRMAVEVAGRNLDLLVGLHMNRTMLRYVRCAHKIGLPLVLSEHGDPRTTDWIGTFDPDERAIAMAGATLIHLLLDDFVETLDRSARAKARVIPNTIPEPETVSNVAKEKNRYVLLSVSRLVPRKNLSRLITAFAQVADDFPAWDLRLVGNGPQMSVLKAQARAAGLESRVEFSGELDDVYSQYRDADLFVTPSQFEAFGLTLCEAMAHGVPSIGLSACRGINRQIIDGRNGILCDGGDGLNSLDAALKTLMSDPELRVQYGNAAREDFLARYSNDVVFAAWEELFVEAAERPSALERPSHETLMSVRLWEAVWGQLPATKD